MVSLKTIEAQGEKTSKIFFLKIRELRIMSEVHVHYVVKLDLPV